MVVIKYFDLNMNLYESSYIFISFWYIICLYVVSNYVAFSTSTLIFFLPTKSIRLIGLSACRIISHAFSLLEKLKERKKQRGKIFVDPVMSRRHVVTLFTIFGAVVTREYEKSWSMILLNRVYIRLYMISSKNIPVLEGNLFSEVSLVFLNLNQCLIS